MCSGSEEGSYLRLLDFCITQLALKVIMKKKELETPMATGSWRSESMRADLQKGVLAARIWHM